MKTILNFITKEYNNSDINNDKTDRVSLKCFRRFENIVISSKFGKSSSLATNESFFLHAYVALIVKFLQRYLKA